MTGARILLAGLLSGVAAGAQPLPDRWESLLDNPPFGSSLSGAPAAGGPAQFEFRGVLAEAGDYTFCVYDQSRRLADWVKLNETGGPFVARNFNPDRNTLTIEYNGVTSTLALKRAPVPRLFATAPPVASPPPLPVNGPPAPAAGPGNVPPSAANAPNSAEAQRLQNIADEIRRRRGLRQMPPQENPPRRPP